MSEPSKYPAFTATEIDRYLSGKMSSAERNALEKAALEDPFLADALEGYIHTTTPHVDLDSIKKRLSEKTGREKSAIPFFRNNQYLRVAAILLLIAGAGVFITQMTNSPQQEIATSKSIDSLASPTGLDKEMVTQTDKFMFTDTISPKNDLVYAKPAETGNGYIKKQPPAEHNFLIKTEETVSEKSPETATSTNVSIAATGLFKDSSRSIAVKDLNGIEIKGDSIKNLNIVMVESDQVLNEVVVLDKRARGNIPAGPAKPVEEIEPIGGWEGYNTYALSNLKPPQGNEEKPQTGDVVLSFDINTLGEPTNIKVVESFCPSCEKEAKRILQEGPKWKNKNKRNAKIRIRF